MDSLKSRAVSLDLLRKSWKGEAFADTTIDFPHKERAQMLGSAPSCANTPTPKYRLLQEVYC